MKTRTTVWLWFAILVSAVGGIAPAPAMGKPGVQTAKIEIDTKGFQPTSLKLRRGIRARVTFVRTTDATCAKEIVLPNFNIRRALPLNEPVVVVFTPTRRGAFTFVCGMNMMNGQ